MQDVKSIFHLSYVITASGNLWTNWKHLFTVRPIFVQILSSWKTSDFYGKNVLPMCMFNSSIPVFNNQIFTLIS